MVTISCLGDGQIKCSPLYLVSMIEQWKLLKKEAEGVWRDGSAPKSALQLLQRTWSLFSAPTRRVTTSSNSSSMLFCSCQTPLYRWSSPQIPAYMWCPLRLLNTCDVLSDSRIHVVSSSDSWIHVLCLNSCRQTHIHINMEKEKILWNLGTYALKFSLSRVFTSSMRWQW